jgi:hypothetical protein
LSRFVTLVTANLRGQCKIDKAKYEPFKLLEIVQKHDGDAAVVLLDWMRAEGQQMH